MTIVGLQNIQALGNQVNYIHRLNSYIWRQITFSSNSFERGCKGILQEQNFATVQNTPQKDVFFINKNFTHLCQSVELLLLLLLLLTLSELSSANSNHSTLRKSKSYSVYISPGFLAMSLGSSLESKTSSSLLLSRSSLTPLS